MLRVRTLWVPWKQFLLMPVAFKESRSFMWYRRVKLGYVSAREQTTMCSAASLAVQAWVGGSGHACAC
jgi:hypothetical protein